MTSFSSCSRKPWVHSTCDGDLRELLRVPMRSQVYCGVGRSLSEFYWVWCSGRAPHLELRWEPQGSSPFLTSIAGFLYSWNRRVRPRLVLRKGTLLASRVVQGDRPLVALYLEPAGFSGRCNWGVSAPSCCDFIHRVTFEEVSGHRVLIKSGQGNWCLSECGMTHDATFRISF